ncbi:hypothetical protein AAHE18_13G084800 [Arachis hypogaea]
MPLWNISPVTNVIARNPNILICDWWSKSMKILKKQLDFSKRSTKFDYLLWQAWLDRNTFVFEQLKRDPKTHSSKRRMAEEFMQHSSMVQRTEGLSCVHNTQWKIRK